MYFLINFFFNAHWMRAKLFFSQFKQHRRSIRVTWMTSIKWLSRCSRKRLQRSVRSTGPSWTTWWCAGGVCLSSWRRTSRSCRITWPNYSSSRHVLKQYADEAFPQITLALVSLKQTHFTYTTLGAFQVKCTGMQAPEDVGCVSTPSQLPTQRAYKVLNYILPKREIYCLKGAVLYLGWRFSVQ